MVQSAPGEAAFVAVSQRVGLRDAPFHQRIPLYTVGAAPFGGTVQPMPFVGGESDTLTQGEFKATPVGERQKMRVKCIPNGRVGPAPANHMHLACSPPGYRIFGEHPVKGRLVRFHANRHPGMQARDFQAGKGFELFQMFIHFGKFPACVEKHDIGHGFAAFEEHEQHGRAVLSAGEGNHIRGMFHHSSSSGAPMSGSISR